MELSVFFNFYYLFLGEIYWDFFAKNISFACKQNLRMDARIRLI
jgi:hypothetical protein